MRVFVVALALAAACLATPLVTKDLVSRVNRAQTAWRAALNPRFSGETLEGAKSVLSGIRRPNTKKMAAAPLPSALHAPESWDIRAKYPHCASVARIHDQGKCGGCWAFATTSSLSDRFCIADSKKHNIELSPQALLDCDPNSLGCSGGFSDYAFDYINDEGLPLEECDPYTGNDYECPEGSCPAKGVKYQLYYCKPSLWLRHNLSLIREQLYEHGSIAAVFEVFQDFYSYESGIYSHVTGEYVGLHAVTLMGYGSENGQDYWIVKNSWGPEFGEEGYFRIAVDTAGCSFEGSLTTALPQL